MDNNLHIGRMINIFSNRISRRIGKEVAQYGLTGVQGKILGFIYHSSANKDVYQKDIEETFDIRRSSVTSVLQLMEKNGYIKRVSVSEDARLKKIILTDMGLDIQHKIYARIVKFERSLQDELSDEELKTLVNLITRLSDKIAD